ncbi:uncharacterized protein LOC127135094 [Lathyrus oleraceus]|uniref:uncharacterized protein LOC127135094 n=1 Tax=Pisum sativum TaxID=3888 RepID=UPI0021D0326F|nr:uncharacterized protein LOC127135094 [Pisum sativum]
MGNSCMAASSMEWDGEDWESIKQPKQCSSSTSNKVFDEAIYLDHHQNKENDVLGKLRDSCDANGKVTLKISKCELAELLGAIQQKNNNNNQQTQKQMKKKKKELGSAEQVLFRLIKARDHEIAKEHHWSSHWKPVLDTIPEF